MSQRPAPGQIARDLQDMLCAIYVASNPFIWQLPDDPFDASAWFHRVDLDKLDWTAEMRKTPGEFEPQPHFYTSYRTRWYVRKAVNELTEAITR